MDLNLDDILHAVGVQNESNTASAAKISGNYSQIEDIGNQRALHEVAAGEDDAIVAGQKVTAELKAQQNARTFATAAGTNMDSTSEVMSSLGLQLKDASAEAIRAQKVVQDKSSVKLFDDPVQYVLNSITIGDDINYADEASQTANAIADTMAKLNQSTQQTVVTQNAIAATKTAATVDATVDAIKQRAAEQAAVIKQQNIQFNIEGIKEADKLSADNLANMFNARSAIVQDKHLQIAQEQLDESREMHRIALEKKVKEDAFDQDTVDTINKGRAALNLPAIPAGKALQLLKMGGDLGDQIRKQYESGAVMETTGVNTIAENPGSAALTVVQSGAPLAPGMKPVRDLLVSAVSDVANGKVQGAGGVPVNLKDKGAVINATNNHIQDIVTAHAKMIKPGDNTNIYQAPDINSVLKVTPGIAQTNFYQKVLAPQVATGLHEINSDRIVADATTAIKNGTVSFDDATKGITSLYGGVVTTNNTTKDYFRVGIKPQNSFNTRVTISNINTPDLLHFATNQSVTVNLTDANSVNRLLAKKLSAMTAHTNLLSAYGDTQQ